MPSAPKTFSAVLAIFCAIADYLKRERAYVEMAGHELAAAAPFRKLAVADEA